MLRVCILLPLLVGPVLVATIGSTSALSATAPGTTRPYSLSLGQDLLLELVPVQPGTFEQGSPESEPNRGLDETRRTVTLTREFLIGRFPVTRAQFDRFVAATSYRTDAEIGTSGGFGWDGNGLRQDKSFTWRNPGIPQEGDHPVTLVTHDDALAFCRWLKSRTGREFTLPTEAQWEYACRAGTTGAWHHGSTAAQAAEFAWFKPVAGRGTHPVGSLKANPWGLQVGGNVAEWCLDWYGPYPPGPATDPLQSIDRLSDKPRKVLRGGSWLREVQHTRSAARHRNDRKSRNADNGFRVLTYQIQPPPPPPFSPTDPSGVQPPPTSPTPATPQTATPQPATHLSPRPPGTLPAASAPVALPSHAAPSSRARAWATWLIVGMVGLGLPFLAIAAWLVSRSKASGSGGRTSPLTSRRGGRLGPLSAPDSVDDGFWFASDASSEGARFLYSYWLNDQLHQGHVVYQPGTDGQQFVYTGARPGRITVQAAPDDNQASPPMIPPDRPVDSDVSPTDRFLSSGPFPPAY